MSQSWPAGLNSIRIVRWNIMSYVTAPWEALVLPHEVGEGEVPVGGVSLGQEDGVLEADVGAARHLREEVLNHLELVCERGLGVHCGHRDIISE